MNRRDLEKDWKLNEEENSLRENLATQGWEIFKRKTQDDGRKMKVQGGNDKQSSEDEEDLNAYEPGGITWSLLFMFVDHIFRITKKVKALNWISIADCAYWKVTAIKMLQRVWYCFEKKGFRFTFKELLEEIEEILAWKMGGVDVFTVQKDIGDFYFSGCWMLPLH